SALEKPCVGGSARGLHPRCRSDQGPARGDRRGCFVFLTFVVGSVVVFFAFQVNARISEGIERRDVMCAMACLFAVTFVIVYLAPNLWIIAGFFVLSRIGVSLWLFNLYN